MTTKTKTTTEEDLVTAIEAGAAAADLDIVKPTPLRAGASVADITDVLLLVRPTGVGEIATKFNDEGEKTPYVDVDAWEVNDDATVDAVGEDDEGEPNEHVRLWGGVLIEKLGPRLGRTVAVRIIRPKRAYVLAELSNDEVALATKAIANLPKLEVEQP